MQTGTAAKRPAPRWEVVDYKDDVVFDADSISADFGVRHGHYTARDHAKRVARDNTDPVLHPLRARKAT